jgi:tetratricopeptide (TPR) repeat protein
MLARPLSLLTAFWLLLAPVAVAQTTSDIIEREEAERLSACLDLIETDPEGAYEEGLRWLGQGSRPAARFCTAMALIGRGNYAEGAHRLESLANAPDAGGLEKRVVYLAQAGNAWLAAGMPEEAVVTLSNALKLAPKNPGLLVDRASAYILTDRAGPAVGDLNNALDQLPDYPEALFLRARAFLEQNRLSAAFRDIERARELDPDNIDMLVLRGEIREAQRLAGER